MTFHDVVEMNCKKGATTENSFAGVKYMGERVYVGRLCVLSDLKRLPLLGEGRKSWYIIIIC